MPSTLSEIVENKRQEISLRKQLPAREPPQRASGSFLPSLKMNGTRIIAEVKPKSPSAGTLNASVDIVAVTRTYSRYAAAISVLTDAKYFGGSFDALSAVSAQASVPTLCKDFILDEIQVEDARRAGAEAVLLIVKILTEAELHSLHNKIVSLNMVPVVEVQNEAELQTALKVQPECILINNRNLETFETDLKTTTALAPLIPKNIVVISASGIDERSQIDSLHPHAAAFLVGSSLMRSADIERKLRDLCGISNLVKTCGITTLADAKSAIESGADLLGLIFVEESPRKVHPEVAKKICAEIGPERCVGVFRDASISDIKAIQRNVGFKYTQLHGTESVETVRALNPAIKAVSVACRDGVDRASRFGDAQFVLFDLPKGEKQSVSASDIVAWVNEVQPPMPFMIAGGLNPDSVAQVIQSVTAKNFIGVDVASGIESKPGVKNADLLQSFITRAKANAITR
jgi:indole-3-glycerol phosphate synthase/phosphoribosylanthranilate isomerase